MGMAILRSMSLAQIRTFLVLPALLSAFSGTLLSGVIYDATGRQSGAALPLLVVAIIAALFAVSLQPHEQKVEE